MSNNSVQATVTTERTGKKQSTTTWKNRSQKVFELRTTSSAVRLVRRKHYSEVLGMSGSGAKTLVFRMRQRFAALLRQEGAQKLSNPRNTDSEIPPPYSTLPTTQAP